MSIQSKLLTVGDVMLSGSRIFGHIKTSQGGHALTNRLLNKFFSDESNWSLESINNLNTKDQNEKSLEKTVAVSV